MSRDFRKARRAQIAVRLGDAEHRARRLACGHGASGEPELVRPQRLGPIVWCYVPGLFWVRIFGKGFWIKDTDRHPLMFSERNGYRQFWAFRWLR